MVVGLEPQDLRLLHFGLFSNLPPRLLGFLNFSNSPIYSNPPSNRHLRVSETWLKNNKTQLEYVQIGGYKSEFKNWESKFVGGVGFYIKELMTFNVRNDLGIIDESIEILWIEVQGRNKNTPVLRSI